MPHAGELALNPTILLHNTIIVRHLLDVWIILILYNTAVKPHGIVVHFC